MFDNNTKAYWPNPPKKGGRDARSRLVMSLAKPCPNEWPSFDIKYRHSFPTYEKARSAAKKQNDAEETVLTEPSDLDGRKRSHRKPSRFITSSDEEHYEEIHQNKKIRQVKKSGCSLEKDVDDSDDAEAEQNFMEEVNRILSQPSSKASTSKTSSDAKKGQVSVMMAPRSKTSAIVKGKDKSTASPATKKLLKNVTTNSKEKSTVKNTVFQSKVVRGNDKEGLSAKGDSSSDTEESNTLSNNLEQNKSDGQPRNNTLRLEGNTYEETAASANSEGTQEQVKSLDLVSSLNNSQNENKEMDSSGFEGNGPSNDSQFSIPLTSSIFLNDSEMLQTMEKMCNKIDQQQKEIKKYKKFVAETLQDHSNQLSSILLNQAKILAYVVPEGEELFEPTNMPKLKMKKEEHLQKLEEFLVHPANMKAFVSHLAQETINETNEWDATYQLLKMTVSNKLARCINWDGGKGKIAFHQTHLNKAICAVQLKHFREGKLKLTKDAIKRWFNTSAGRAMEESSESENGSDSETNN